MISHGQTKTPNLVMWVNAPLLNSTILFISNFNLYHSWRTHIPLMWSITCLDSGTLINTSFIFLIFHYFSFLLFLPNKRTSERIVIFITKQRQRGSHGYERVNTINPPRTIQHSIIFWAQQTHVTIMNHTLPHTSSISMKDSPQWTFSTYFTLNQAQNVWVKKCAIKFEQITSNNENKILSPALNSWPMCIHGQISLRNNNSSVKYFCPTII